MYSDEAVRIIDEYLNEVKRYLPSDIADDVVAELRTHIIDKAEDMGGLTVENVYVIIGELGEPRRLASRYVVGRGRKKFRFELGIAEDIYPYFVLLLFIIILCTIFGYTVALLVKIASGEFMDVKSVIGFLWNIIVSIFLTVVFLYVAMSIISEYPELKEKFKTTMEESFGFLLRKKSPRSEEKIISKKKHSPWGNLLSAVFSTIIAYVVLLYGLKLHLNLLMGLFLYLVVTYIVAVAIIDYAHFFYILYNDKKSYTLEVIRSILVVIFVPWFFIANIYPENIQIFAADFDALENDNFHSFLDSITLVSLPSEYILLAKIITLMILIAIIVGSVITMLKYARTRPRIPSS